MPVSPETPTTASVPMGQAHKQTEVLEGSIPPSLASSLLGRGGASDRPEGTLFLGAPQ